MVYLIYYVNEKCVGEAGVTEEKERRREQAKRIVQRLLHSHLARAFDSYGCRVSEVRRQRETCRRVVLRMQHAALAGAFETVCGMSLTILEDCLHGSNKFRGYGVSTCRRTRAAALSAPSNLKH
jgi:hypothetical protein